MPQEIQLFADKQIRTYWDDDKELYFFCIMILFQKVCLS